jgi:hypothetical protein
MRRAEAVFAAYLAVLAAGMAFMAMNSLVVAGSAIPRDRSSGQVTATAARSAGPVPPSRVAGAFGQNGR